MSREKKTAVGTAIPATENKYQTTDIIPENNGKIKCVFQGTNKLNSEIICIEGTRKGFREQIGGEIEMFNLGDNIILVMDKEGKARGRTPNIYVGSEVIYGDVVISKSDPTGEPISLTTEEIQEVRGWLLRNKFLGRINK